MTSQKTPQEIVDFAAALHGTLRTYLDMDTWTPIMGALLLAGVRPPDNCTELPKSGGVGLDDVEIVGPGTASTTRPARSSSNGMTGARTAGATRR